MWNSCHSQPSQTCRVLSNSWGLESTLGELVKNLIYNDTIIAYKKIRPDPLDTSSNTGRTNTLKVMIQCTKAGLQLLKSHCIFKKWAKKPFLVTSSLRSRISAPHVESHLEEALNAERTQTLPITKMAQWHHQWPHLTSPEGHNSQNEPVADGQWSSMRDKCIWYLPPHCTYTCTLQY